LFFLCAVNRCIDFFSSFPGSSSPTSACGGIGLDSSDPLLPTSYGLTNGTVNGSNSPNSGIKEENSGAVDGESGVVKANKGMILRKSVDYIRYGFFISIFLMRLTVTLLLC
jgi:hypothetical protein